MDRGIRAKQFMPFDTLKGFREAVAEKERIIVPKRDISEEQKEELEWKIRQLKKEDIITVEYFQNREYVQVTGMITRIDEVSRTLDIANTRIAFVDISDLKYALINNFRAYSEIKNNSLDFMFKLIDSGVKDTNNYVNKTTFESIEESLLISNNVQIPLVHIFLPVNYNGIFMFSELWISKEIYDENVNENSKDASRKSENSDLYKFFLTFDIDNVGYFETIIFSKNNKVSLEIFVPSSLKDFSSKIKTDITNIVKKNNIAISDIYVNECTRQRKFNEVFGTKFIKERGINVIA